MNQPEVFGKYLLLGCVAIGGMAEIFKARLADPNGAQRDIAIKRILPSYTEDEGFVTMFKDEGNIARRLEHPNIVKVYEVDEFQGNWFIAMEFVHGTDLRVLSDLCEKHSKRFTPCQIARIMAETAKALDYSHACTDDRGAPLNIVHRDATPHNIMVTYDGHVKLMDFGIAKAASRATKTRVGTVKGKSSYMSPEQARGKSLDGRSDMFTLGAVVWELLTGTRLFKAPSDFEILSKVLKAKIIHPSDIDPNIPRALGDIVMTTLERDVQARYANCGKLAEALENYLTWHGDGSEQQLGFWVAALTSQQGRTPNDIPNYQAATGLYQMNEAGNFEPIQQISPPQAMGMASDYQNPYQEPVNPALNAPNPQYPSYPPMGGFAPPPIDAYTGGHSRAKGFMGLIIAAAVLTIFSIAFFILSFTLSSDGSDEARSFTPPLASVTFKSTPTGAKVSINGEALDSITPVTAYQAKIGDKLAVAFELDGHETYTTERILLSPSTDISAQLTSLKSLEEAKTKIAQLTIKTTPEGLNILVNGKPEGKSPVTIKDLPLNKILSIEAQSADDTKGGLIRFYTPEKAGEDEVLLALGKSPEPAKAAEQAPAKTSVKKTTSTKTTSRPKTPAATAGGKGKISVKAIPWAIVTIDGKRIGNTPILNREVGSGSHTIELSFPPKNNKRVSKKVTIKKEGSASVGYNFTSDAWL